MMFSRNIQNGKQLGYFSYVSNHYGLRMICTSTFCRATLLPLDTSFRLTDLSEKELRGHRGSPFLHQLKSIFKITIIRTFSSKANNTMQNPFSSQSFPYLLPKPRCSDGANQKCYKPLSTHTKTLTFKSLSTSLMAIMLIFPRGQT